LKGFLHATAKEPTAKAVAPEGPFRSFPRFLSFTFFYSLFERWAAWVAVSPGQTGAYFVGISPTFFFRVCFWHRAKGMSWQRKKSNF